MALNSSQSPPAPIRGPVLVAAAIIEDSKDQVLIALRPATNGVEGGKWEFPGGKVEPGEDPTATVLREIKEELGIEVRLKGFAGLSSHVYGPKEEGGPSTHVVLLFYRCEYGGGTFQLSEVDDVRWVSKSKRPDVIFAEADEPILGQVFR